jgi:hypothetical protein
MAPENSIAPDYILESRILAIGRYSPRNATSGFTRTARARRDERRQDGHQQQPERQRNERHRVARAHAEEQARPEARQGLRGGDADRECDGADHHRLLQHAGQEVRPAGAERHADANHALASLTVEERAILTLSVAGWTDRDIAEALNRNEELRCPSTGSSSPRSALSFVCGEAMTLFRAKLEERHQRQDGLQRHPQRFGHITLDATKLIK